MTWKRLLADDRVVRHSTTREELTALRGAAERNLADAALPALSTENRFGLAYEAALLMAKMVIACAGYRVKGPGAHLTTFQALELGMGPRVARQASFFDQCRRKRNVLSYEHAGAASDTEAAEILREAEKLRTDVEAWIAREHPDLTG